MLHAEVCNGDLLVGKLLRTMAWLERPAREGDAAVVLAAWTPLEREALPDWVSDDTREAMQVSIPFPPGNLGPIGG